MSKRDVSVHYKEVLGESRELIMKTLPSLALNITVTVIVWLFSRLAFLSITFGAGSYPPTLTETLNIIILLVILVFVGRILVDARRLINGFSGLIACNLKSRDKISVDEIRRYRSAFGGILYVMAVSMIFLLLNDYLTRMSPLLSGSALMILVLWSIYQIYSSLRVISGEIGRYMADLAERFSEAGLGESTGGYGGKR